MSISFFVVFKKNYWIKIQNMIQYKCSHKPIEVESKYINIFGHIHDKPLDEKFNKENHICVSCDVINYTPIIL